LSSLGALTAVFMLVFKDSLLSLVAGIQLTTNRLIQVGDWIEMPKFNANGTVIEIALNTVKVQNFDKTISVLPAHIFLENSFINWRGMSESGGRRIKRSINIDMTSIRFLNNDDISRFKKFSLLEKYMTEKIQSLSTDSAVTSDDLPENHRRLTNIGTFRAYVVNYLNENSKIRKDMTFIVRQLQPTAQGLPLEVYVFADETRWAEYEGIQADVFDHLLAIVNSFDLRVYQEPSGHDLQKFLNN
ncbi:MAG: mechanosensitive ion channel family protein, partial [Bdellovibrionota bacterium]